MIIWCHPSSEKLVISTSDVIECAAKDRNLCVFPSSGGVCRNTAGSYSCGCLGLGYKGNGIQSKKVVGRVTGTACIGEPGSFWFLSRWMKGNSTGKWSSQIFRVWVGDWLGKSLPGQFCFISEMIYPRPLSKMSPNDVSRSWHRWQKRISWSRQGKFYLCPSSRPTTSRLPLNKFKLWLL